MASSDLPDYALKNREEWTKARAVMERLMLLDPDAPGHVRDYGTLLMKEGDFNRGAAPYWLR